MKSTMGILTGIAALATVACLGGGVRAQQGGIQQTSAVQPAPLRTRIALVNLPQVIKSYQKYQAFEREWQETYKNFDAQYEGKRKLLASYQESAQKAPDQGQRDMIEHKMRDLQREMQDMGEEAKKQLGKKRDDQAVIIYREIEEAIQVYARAKDIELVMHFNEALTPADMYNPMNVQRKLQLGATFPVYAAPGMDITNDIVTMLNTRYQRTTSQPAAAPTR